MEEVLVSIERSIAPGSCRIIKTVNDNVIVIDSRLNRNLHIIDLETKQKYSNHSENCNDIMYIITHYLY